MSVKEFIKHLLDLKHLDKPIYIWEQGIEYPMRVVYKDNHYVISKID